MAIQAKIGLIVSKDKGKIFFFKRNAELHFVELVFSLLTNIPFLYTFFFSFSFFLTSIQENL